MTAQAPLRLFFALWPDDDTRRRLSELARARLGGGGRPVVAHNLHLTLVFLGNVSAELRDCAERAAERLSVAAFTLEFERIGHWPRSRVLWSAPDATPDALDGLVAKLTQALVACGHEPESRPFHAHVTLARKVRGPVAERRHDPVRWHVGDFHLVESETHPDGARYRSLKSWPLT